MNPRELAESTTILRATTGSTIHGLNLPGKDDLDEMGVCVEDLDEFGGFHEFEQFIYRSAAEREGRHDAPSQPGDLDLTIYSLRKFLRLAMHGNPTVVNLLFIPPSMCSVRNSNGAHLQELAPLIISRQAGKRFLGYMEAQRQRLLGERGQKKTNRPELEAAHGFDTKYAMHILRLGFQGVELLNYGRITFPLPEKERSFVFSVRKGEVPLQDVLTKAGDLERELKDLLDNSPLRESPDEARVQEWMLETYFQAWSCRRTSTNHFEEDLIETNRRLNQLQPKLKQRSEFTKEI